MEKTLREGNICYTSSSILAPFQLRWMIFVGMGPDKFNNCFSNSFENQIMHYFQTSISLVISHFQTIHKTQEQQEEEWGWGENEFHFEVYFQRIRKNIIKIQEGERVVEGRLKENEWGRRRMMVVLVSVSVSVSGMCFEVWNEWGRVSLN